MTMQRNKKVSKADSERHYPFDLNIHAARLHRWLSTAAEEV